MVLGVTPGQPDWFAWPVWQHGEGHSRVAARTPFVQHGLRVTARTELFADGTLTDHSGTGVWAAFARSTAGSDFVRRNGATGARRGSEESGGPCTIVSDHEGMVGIAQRGMTPRMCKPLGEELDEAAASKDVTFEWRRRDQSLGSRLAPQLARDAALGRDRFTRQVLDRNLASPVRPAHPADCRSGTKCPPPDASLSSAHPATLQKRETSRLDSGS